MMELSAYAQTHACQNGGICFLGVIPSNAVEEIEYDPGSGCYTGVRFAGEERFVRIEFREDTGSYREQTLPDKGIYGVQHTLQFSVDAFVSHTHEAIGRLLHGAGNGLLALIQTTGGQVFLVGYSKKFNTEQPLLLTEASEQTGSANKNQSVHRIVLQSWDCSRSLPYTGETDVLFQPVTDQ